MPMPGTPLEVCDQLRTSITDCHRHVVGYVRHDAVRGLRGHEPRKDAVRPRPVSKLTEARESGVHRTPDTRRLDTNERAPDREQVCTRDQAKDGFIVVIGVVHAAAIGLSDPEYRSV